jgi:hypothetical protein
MRPRPTRRRLLPGARRACPFVGGRHAVDELVGPAGAGVGPALAIDVVSFAVTPPA